MKKIFCLLLFGLLTVNIGIASAKENVTDKQKNFTFETVDDYNFEDNSYYVSDEQLQDAKDMNKIEDNSSFWAKIINSSHFSSNTATRTYIPINKVK